MTQHRQLLADFWVEEPRLLEQLEPLWPVLLEAVRASGAIVLDQCRHQFQPHGFTGVVLLAQSHVSVHSWVEQRLLLLDVQTCGDMQPRIIVDRLAAFLQPCQVKLRECQRGLEA